MAQNVKFSVSFWQMFIIVIVAVVLGGIIYKYAYDNVLLDELNSISFSRHRPAANDSPKAR